MGGVNLKREEDVQKEPGHQGEGKHLDNETPEVRLDSRKYFGPPAKQLRYSSGHRYVTNGEVTIVAVYLPSKRDG